MVDYEKYYQGETVRQKAHVTNVVDADVDPDTIKITIEDSAGAKKVTDAAMIKDGVGFYHYDHDLPGDAELGTWTTEVEAQKTQIAIEQDKFVVLEAL